MNHTGRRATLHRQLRQVGWCWCILVGIGGTVGGVLALLERDNDDA